MKEIKIYDDLFLFKTKINITKNHILGDIDFGIFFVLGAINNDKNFKKYEKL